MNIYNSSDIEKININESIIMGFSWINNKQDFKIIIDWNGQENLKNIWDFNKISTHLYFDFVTDVEFNFKFNENTMGAIEITSFKFNPSNQGLFAIEFLFDFYPVGFIKFVCNDFRFVIEDVI